MEEEATQPSGFGPCKRSSGEIPCSDASASSHFGPNDPKAPLPCSAPQVHSVWTVSPDFWVENLRFEVDVMIRELSWVWIFLSACGHCTSMAHLPFGETVPCLGTSAVALGTTDLSCVLPAQGFGFK